MLKLQDFFTDAQVLRNIIASYAIVLVHVFAIAYAT